MAGRKCVECGRSGCRGAHLMCKQCYTWAVLVRQGMCCAYCGEDLSTFEPWQYELCHYTTFTAQPGESVVEVKQLVLDNNGRAIETTVGLAVANKVGCRTCYLRFRSKGMLKDMRRTGIRTTVSYEERLSELPAQVHAEIFKELEERIKQQAMMKYGAKTWNAQPEPAGSRRFHLIRILSERGYNPVRFGFKLTVNEATMVGHIAKQVSGTETSKKTQTGAGKCKCAYCDEARPRGRQLKSGNWLCVECKDMPID